MEEMELWVEGGGKIRDMIDGEGWNVVSFGEMGIGKRWGWCVWMDLVRGI